MISKGSGHFQVGICGCQTLFSSSRYLIRIPASSRAQNVIDTCEMMGRQDGYIKAFPKRYLLLEIMPKRRRRAPYIRARRLAQELRDRACHQGSGQKDVEARFAAGDLAHLRRETHAIEAEERAAAVAQGARRAGDGVEVTIG